MRSLEGEDEGVVAGRLHRGDVRREARGGKRGVGCLGSIGRAKPALIAGLALGGPVFWPRRNLLPCGA